MLRDSTLVPLSHQHQHGLALCVLVERGLRDGKPVEELARKVADAFEVELKNHFDVEERILFPAILEHLGPTPMVGDLIADHRRLEKLAADAASGREALLAFTGALSAHIRREERELFEDIQKRLPRDVLDRLGTAIAADVVKVCL